jgi:hypothetical protein
MLVFYRIRKHPRCSLRKKECERDRIRNESRQEEGDRKKKKDSLLR